MNNQNLVEPEKTFDGRSLPCSVKHGLIVQKWLNLAVGDYFVLVNDHDPAPLRDQLSVQWPQAFLWEYLAKNPGEFRVKITKLDAIAPIGEVVQHCGVKTFA
jgi:uncharacterized protein (DUF2249 family)